MNSLPRDVVDRIVRLACEGPEGCITSSVLARTAKRFHETVETTSPVTTLVFDWDFYARDMLPKMAATGWIRRHGGAVTTLRVVGSEHDLKIALAEFPAVIDLELDHDDDAEHRLELEKLALPAGLRRLFIKTDGEVLIGTPPPTLETLVITSGVFIPDFIGRCPGLRTFIMDEYASADLEEANILDLAASRIEHLVLSDVYFASESIQHLLLPPTIQTLNIRRMTVEHLAEGTFAGVRGLTSLVLPRRQVSVSPEPRLPREVWNGLRNLEVQLGHLPGFVPERPLAAAAPGRGIRLVLKTDCMHRLYVREGYTLFMCLKALEKISARLESIVLVVVKPQSKQAYGKAVETVCPGVPLAMYDCSMNCMHLF